MEYKLVLRISGAGFKELVTSPARRPVTVDSTKSRGGWITTKQFPALFYKIIQIFLVIKTLDVSSVYCKNHNVQYSLE